MRETTRTFIAIPIPEAIGQKLTRKQAELTPEVPGCRWTTGSAFHLTLAFLGDVRNRDLDELCRGVAAAAEPFVRLELESKGLGAFPSPQKPRVIWAGITASDLNPLLDLRKAIVLATTQAGYRPDDLRFHPHITLGRIKADRGDGDETNESARRERFARGRSRAPRGDEFDMTELVQREQSWSAGTFTAAEVVTYASTLDPKGSIYAPLGRARLAGKKTQERA
jgi:2'-5' RNA ligase